MLLNDFELQPKDESDGCDISANQIHAEEITWYISASFNAQQSRHRTNTYTKKDIKIYYAEKNIQTNFQTVPSWSQRRFLYY